MGGRGAAGTQSGRGYVTLYHHTSPAAAAAIIRDGFNPKYTPGTQDWYRNLNRDKVFFTRKLAGARGFGTATVAVRVPRSKVHRDPWSGHVFVHLNDMPKKRIRHTTDPHR